MKKITEKQNRILNYISDYIKNNGYSPSIRDIAKEVGIKSTSTIAGHLDRLEKKGLIERTYGISRSIRITK